MAGTPWQQSPSINQLTSLPDPVLSNAGDRVTEFQHNWRRHLDAHDNFIVLGFGHFHSRERYPELAVLVIKDCSCSPMSATFAFM
jgi:hypothetical protein